MLKSSDVDKTTAVPPRNFKGVQKRKWGKYVCEIRLPNSRDQIWLGSHDTAEPAARAFDAAQFCLRGNSARFNFADNPPEIPNAGSYMTPDEIRAAEARFAQSEPGSGRMANSRLASPQLVLERECEMTALPKFGTDNYASEFELGAFPGIEEYDGDFFVPAPTNGYFWQDNYGETDYWDVSPPLWNF